ncbi:MAG: T9SS type A sorting domain-containing protein [Candidatus Coatesbacteria bacterium]|nr:T9SS type A sorting domain-containing protein [Candidatus Coatesbacteria bacterium]
MYKLMLVIFMMASSSLFCWEKTFGTTGYDAANCVIETTDHGYAMCGYISGSYLADIYLVKTDANGNKLFEKTYAYTMHEDCGNFIQETADLGFIICGYTGNAKALFYISLIKTDSSGNLTWSRQLGRNYNDYCYGNCVRELSDGYIICGKITQIYTESYVYLVKTDLQGNTIWSKVFDKGSNAVGNSIQLTNDGGFIICGTGYNSSTNSNDIYLIKTDSSGNKIWDYCYGGNGINDAGFGVQQTSDNGYIICGCTDSSTKVRDAAIIKVNSSGAYVWGSLIGGNDLDEAHSIQIASDGYVLCGITKSYGAGATDVYLFKTDFSGNLRWQKTYGGSNEDYGYYSEITYDNRYIMAGVTYSYGSGYADCYLVKHDEQTGFTDYKSNFKLPMQSFTANPNPFSSRLSLSLPSSGAVYSLTGQLIMNLPKGKHSVDTSKWREGVYIVKSGKETKRIVKIR